MSRRVLVSVLQLLVLLLLALLVLVPLLWLVSTSLKGPAEDIFSSPPALLPSEPSLQAYVRLFQDNPLTTYLLNSTVVSALAVLANLLFCSMAAYPLARMRFAGRGLVLGLVRRARGASVAVPSRMRVLDVRWWRCWSVRVSSAVDALSKVR